MACNYAGADWLLANSKHWKKVPNISSFGKRVADLLGEVFEGLYHLEEKALRRTDWESDHYIQICLYGELATYDASLLTELVVLCHDRCIRLEIRGKGPRYLGLGFSIRQRTKSVFTHHPTMEEAVARTRERYTEPTPPPDVKG